MMLSEERLTGHIHVNFKIRIVFLLSRKLNRIDMENTEKHSITDLETEKLFHIPRSLMLLRACQLIAL